MKIICKSVRKSVILSTNKNVIVNIGTEQMQNNEKLLGIKIDSELNSKDQIGRICTKNQCKIKCFD